MLDAVSELAQNDVRNVERILADEINPGAFRAYQSHHLLDLLFHRRLHVSKKQVRLIEKENEFGLFGIANLGEALKEFGEQPEEKRRVNFRRLLHELFGCQDIDDTAPALGLDEVIEIERRLTEKLVGALRFQFEKIALDCPGACRRNIAILRFELLRIGGDVLHHRAKILQIEQQQAAFVGNLENHVQNALLRIIQAEQTTKQEGPHLRYCGAHRMSVAIAG